MKAIAVTLILFIFCAALAAPVAGQASPRSYLPMLAKRAALIQDPPTPTPAPRDR